MEKFVGSIKIGRIVLANYQTEKLFGWRRAKRISQSNEVFVSERFGDKSRVQRCSLIGSQQTRP